MSTFAQMLALTLGSNIKNLRRVKFPEKGSLKNCAQALGIDPSYLVRWEAGKVLPSEENQAKLAEFFAVTVAELRGDSPLVLCEECRKKEALIKKKDALIEYLHEELAERKRVIYELTHPEENKKDKRYWLVEKIRSIFNSEE